jgi:3-keto-5-aminohexanoate cleavage enzyme
MEKLIITIAPTGNVPTKENNANSPLTVDEIVADIKKCKNLGASVAHIHVRDENLKPTSDRSLFEKVLNNLDKDNVDIIKQVSTGARGGENTIAWRGQMLDLPNADMASLSTGSSNFPSSVNSNSPELVEALAKKMLDNNLKPEIEVFDTAMLFQALFYLKKGILKGPLHFNFVLDVKGSMPATPKNLMFLVDNLPKDATWNISGIGNSQVQMITMAIAMGGHVRTGLEDVLKYDSKTLATNEMLIKRVVNIANAVGREIATVDESRKILGLI